jgi:hypothetical protein
VFNTVRKRSKTSVKMAMASGTNKSAATAAAGISPREILLKRRWEDDCVAPPPALRPTISDRVKNENRCASEAPTFRLRPIIMSESSFLGVAMCTNFDREAETQSS